jgi:hypothetical protein
MIALLIFVTFITSTFFLSGSPIVDGSGENVGIQSDAEMVLVQMNKNGLTDRNGEYDPDKIESVIQSDSTDPYTSVNTVNATMTLHTPTPSDKPAMFNGSGDTIVVGETPPSVGVTNTTTTILVDDRVVEVTISAWRNQNYE